jgi:hypothetical protein
MQRTSRIARIGMTTLLGLLLAAATAGAWYPVTTQAELGTATW